MARFDVIENPSEATQQAVPFLLDVQADRLDGLSTRVVVPLIAASAMGKPIEHLNPQFTISTTTVLISPAELAGISVRSPGEKVSSLKDQRHELIAALDSLFMGF